MSARREGDLPASSVGVFLQARIGSTRLPGKVLLPLSGRTVVEHAMTALRRCDASVHLLLTDRSSERVLAPYARRCGFEMFAGDPVDVLARFADGLREHPVDRIVRATADNPLVSSELADRLLSVHAARHADFSGFLGMPLGLGVEIVEAQALLIEHRESVDPYEREHVNPFLYRRPDRFAILHPRAPREYRLENRSVTLDTESDYRYLELLFEDLYHGEPIDTLDVIDWLKRHPRDQSLKEVPPGQKGAVRSLG